MDNSKTNSVDYVKANHESLNRVLMDLANSIDEFSQIWDIAISHDWLNDEWIGMIYGELWNNG